MFLDAVGGHRRACINYDPSHFVLQHLDYLEFIDIYHERIKAFHVKDAELNPTGRQGVYSGYQPWVNRAGRFRSLGDGQVNFAAVFSKMAQYDYNSWAVLEWECCLKHPEDGAREGASFIKNHLIRVTEKSFDDFVTGSADQKKISADAGDWLGTTLRVGGRHRGRTQQFSATAQCDVAWPGRQGAGLGAADRSGHDAGPDGGGRGRWQQV